MRRYTCFFKRRVRVFFGPDQILTNIKRWDLSICKNKVQEVRDPAFAKLWLASRSQMSARTLPAP